MSVSTLLSIIHIKTAVIINSAIILNSEFSQLHHLLEPG